MRTFLVVSVVTLALTVALPRAVAHADSPIGSLQGCVGPSCPGGGSSSSPPPTLEPSAQFAFCYLAVFNPPAAAAAVQAGKVPPQLVQQVAASYLTQGFSDQGFDDNGFGNYGFANASDADECDD